MRSSREVSVLVLTRGRGEALLRTVESALALPERPPVVVVDGGSADGSPQRMKERFPQVKLVRLPFDMGPMAWDVGVQCIDTPFIACSDDDLVWEPGALGAACGLLRFYPRLGVLSARVVGEADGREEPACARMAASVLPSRGVPGRAQIALVPGASVLRRRAFIEAGGYEPRLAHAAAQTLLAYDLAAAGWTLAYAPQVGARRTSAAAPPPALAPRERLRIAWLRRSLASALEETLAFFRSEGLAGLSALADARWLAENRRALPAAVEGLCRLAEGRAPLKAPRSVPRPA